MSVERRGNDLYVVGKLTRDEAEMIVREAGSILSGSSQPLALHVEAAQENSETIGLVLNKKLDGLVRRQEAGTKTILAVAGRQLDLSMLGLFLVGERRLVYPGTVLLFHPPQLIAFDAGPRHGVSYADLSDCLGRLTAGQGCRCGEEALWSFFQRFSDSPYPEMQLVYNAGLMMAVGQCCCASRELFKRWFGQVLFQAEVLAALLADLTARRSNLTTEAVLSLMHWQSRLSAEAAICCGLAHGYVE